MCFLVYFVILCVVTAEFLLHEMSVGKMVWFLSWEEWGRNLGWSVGKYYYGIIRRAMSTSQSPSWDSSEASPEYEAEVVTTTVVVF